MGIEKIATLKIHLEFNVVASVKFDARLGPSQKWRPSEVHIGIILLLHFPRKRGRTRTRRLRTCMPLLSESLTPSRVRPRPTQNDAPISTFYSSPFLRYARSVGMNVGLGRRAHCWREGGKKEGTTGLSSFCATKSDHIVSAARRWPETRQCPPSASVRVSSQSTRF